MKKIFFMLTAAILFSQLGKAQNCACNPNGWQPFTAIINNVTSTVNCGHQFSLRCNDKITLRGSYKCLGTCVATYKAVLKNSSGVVIQTWSPLTFPLNYTFPTAGNYSLEITPICGTAACTPCRFYFTVTCPTTVCDCKTNGWQPFTAYIGTEKKTVNCGFQFGLKKNVPFRLDGKYICAGTCVAKYTAVLKNNVTGAIIQNYPVFSFVWGYTFLAVGNYKLEITPICGTKKCQPCVFYFTVTP